MSGAASAVKTPEGSFGGLPAARELAPVRLLFAAALFLSAACLFMVQPMLGKMLLPLVGGTPAGWVTTLAFFQLMLLAGYALAFALAKLPARRHGLAFVAALLAGAAFLPPHLPADIAGAQPGAFLVFRLLFSAVGIPFVALSAASSTLQRLYATTADPRARDPYFLYAASNLGSFAGLLAYPLAIESLLNLQEQARLWLGGYALLALLAAACTLRAGNGAQDTSVAPAAASPAPIPRRQRLAWIALAFLPSSLLLGVTSHITTDVISAPLVWVLPLGLYLLTFVAAFSRRPPVALGRLEQIHPTVVALAIVLMLIINGFMPLSVLAMVWHLLAFTVTALLCHMRLAGLRPLGDARRLPDYYLMIALGGALGGALNAFIAPLVFDRMAEYPLVLLLSCLANPRIKAPFSFRQGMLFLLGAFAMTAVSALTWRGKLEFEPLRNALIFGIFVLVTFHPRAALLAGAALYLVTQFYGNGHMVLQARNFYGVMRVYDRLAPDTTPLHKPGSGKTVQARLFRHGTTTHGAQILTPGYETLPISYFSPRGPVGDVFRALQPRNVAVMGLGTGTLACYEAPGRRFTFFEIDPAVVDMARRDFSFLSRCGGASPPRIILGDGRLKFAQLAPEEKFDLIVLDAFSSDMVPVHLLTQEALRLYLSRLAPHGVLLFNISNRFLRLEDTLAAGAAAAGLSTSVRVDERMEDPFLYPSGWFAMAHSAADLAPLRVQSKGWVSWDAPPGIKPWTDGYSSVLSALAITDY